MDARFAQAYTGQPKWVCTCDNSAAGSMPSPSNVVVCKIGWEAV